MIVQEKITKDGTRIADKHNELGLRLNQTRIIDWSPMWVILLYDDKETFKPKKPEE